MHKHWILYFLLVLSLFSSCKRDEEVVVQPELSLSNFMFAKANNTSLTADVYAYVDGQKMNGHVPYEATIGSLTASFDFVGKEVRVGNQVQSSGITQNDFSTPVTYTVVGEDNSTKDYSIAITWFTGLPIIYLQTENGVEILSKDDYVNGFATIHGGPLYADVSGEMKIKGRGHSTWYVHPKKPYQLKFDDETAVLGMPQEKKWIFLAEYSDKTLIRNNLAFEMGYLSKLEWTPACRYSEVFINDAYNGTYNITEKVEASTNRLNIGSNGFLCEIDTPDHLEEGDIYFQSTRYSTIQIKEPETTFESTQYNYIKDFVIEFENVLYSANFKDPVNGYRKYIDVESFVDWYLINEIAKNVDSRFYSSIYFHLIPGQKIKMGPLWDFDLGFGNVDYADPQYPEGFWVKDHEWISRLFQDPYFVDQVKSRFAYFKSQQGDLLRLIDEKAAYLKWAQAENNERWDVLGHYVWPNPVVYDTYNEEVDHLKDWFLTRMNWLDTAFSGM